MLSHVKINIIFLCEKYGVSLWPKTPYDANVFKIKSAITEIKSVYTTF